MFPVTENDADVATVVQAAAEELGLTVHRPEVPFAWSEDFGHFTATCPGVLFGLGAGENHPALHNPDYDFPDELLPVGVNILSTTARKLLQR